MKANKLMIGDWVYIHHNGNAPHYGKVTALLSSGEVETEINGILALSSSVEPIPITPEILEKNGFEENIWEGKNSWRRKYLVHNEVRICIDGRDGGLKHFGYQGYNSKICLTYVHELQHALRLCGIEKEITFSEVKEKNATNE